MSTGDATTANGPRGGDLCLRWLDGTLTTELMLTDRLTVIGSDARCDIVLAESGVSRRHASVRRARGLLIVEDLGSKNGTWIDGARVNQAELTAGQSLRLGTVTLIVDVLSERDSEIAIAVEGGQAQAARETVGDTASLVSGAVPARWLRALARAARILAGSHGDTRLALEPIAAALEANGLALIEETRGERCVRVTWGDVTSILDRGELEHGSVLDRVSTASGSHDPGSHPRVGVRRGPMLLVACGTTEAPDLAHELLGPTLDLILPGLDESTPAGHAGSHHRLTFPPGHVAGVSPVIEDMYAQLRRLAGGSIPVLLTGETGVGKEHIARILHLSSGRAPAPFLAVNCAAIPADLLESELFGIERGVATGVEPRRGAMLVAGEGTLLLDEIGDMSTSLQAKLLRALQEREIRPVGASRSQALRARVVSSTNADLTSLMEQGRFRRDLYYRIAGYELRVPPLRERRQDIPLLVQHFLESITAEEGLRVRGISAAALDALLQRDWPGNIRELQNEVRRLAYLCPEGQIITSSLLAFPGQPSASDEVDSLNSLSLQAHIEDLERRLITEALHRTDGARTKAAELLGISRQGLALKLRRLHLEPSGNGKELDVRRSRP